MNRFVFCILTLCALTLVPNLSAANCGSTSDCTFTFDTKNVSASFPSTGPFGTVELQLVSSDIKFTINLASGFRLINTGAGAGSFGFNDTVNESSALTFTFPANYSGSLTNTTGLDNTTNDFHFDGFGFFDDAWATSGPSAGSGNGLNSLSFTATRSGGFTDVNQLVDLSEGGDVGAFFVADVFQSTNCTGSCTGLIAVTRTAVPEPTSYLALLTVGFGAIVLLVERRRRNRLTAA